MSEACSSFSLMYRPAVYRIRVCGRLGPEWSDIIGAMTVSVTERENREPVTELKGELEDQAALMGLLQHFYACCVPMLSMECIDPSPLKDEVSPLI
jgi:hypothetical protein